MELYDEGNVLYKAVSKESLETKYGDDSEEVATKQFLEDFNKENTYTPGASQRPF